MATLLPARGHAPVLDASVWLAPNATVVGEVHMGAESTVWFSAVVRGDVARIQIGRRVNIQDGAVIHGTFGQSQTVLEDDVSIGHNAIVHGAHVKHSALIGMGSVVMDHVIVGEGAVVAAGAVVLAGTTAGSFELLRNGMRVEVVYVDFGDARIAFEITELTSQQFQEY